MITLCWHPVACAVCEDTKERLFKVTARQMAHGAEVPVGCEMQRLTIARLAKRGCRGNPLPA
jgi:hypothetical protein